MNYCSGNVFLSEMGKEIEATCLELALEGERLCKAGDCYLGIQFLEAAVRLGTEDLKTIKQSKWNHITHNLMYTSDSSLLLPAHCSRRIRMSSDCKDL